MIVPPIPETTRSEGYGVAVLPLLIVIVAELVKLVGPSAWPVRANSRQSVATRRGIKPAIFVGRINDGVFTELFRLAEKSIPIGSERASVEPQLKRGEVRSDLTQLKDKGGVEESRSDLHSESFREPLATASKLWVN